MSFRLDQLKPLKDWPTGISETGTDWDALRAKTDEQIAADVASDPDAPPLLDEKFWANAVGIDYPKGKASLTIRLDLDVFQWFRSTGKGYQTRMNAVLKSYVAAQKAAAKKKASR